MTLSELMTEEGEGSPLMSFNYHIIIDNITSLLFVYYLILLKILPQASFARQRVNSTSARLCLFLPILVHLALAEWPVHSQGSVMLFTERRKEGGRRKEGAQSSLCFTASALPPSL